MGDYQSDKKLIKHYDFILMDFVILEVSFLIANFFKFCVREQLPFYILKFQLQGSMYRHQMIILAFSLLLTLLFGNPYKDILRRNRYDELWDTTKHTLKLLVIHLLCMFFIHETIFMSREVTIYLWLLYLLLEFGFRVMWKRHLRRLYRNSHKRNAMIVLTESSKLPGLIDRLQEDPLRGYFISAIFLTDFQAESRKKIAGNRSSQYLDESKFSVESDEKLTYHHIPVIGSDEDMASYASHNWVDEALFQIPDQKKIEQNLLDVFLEMGIRTHTILDYAALENESVGNQFVESLSGYAVVTTTPRIVPFSQIFLKRLLDIVGGLIGCAITGVLALFVAPAIYKKSPGPIFFGQKRVGKNGKIFTMYKFRSMYLDAEERKKALMEENKIKNGMMFKIDDDPRIIGSERKDKNGNPKGIGNFIRRTSIDEFPQFFNVLRGDMSIVGTRPPTLDEWENYSPKYRARMSIRPGITGLWQISGRSNIVDFDQVVELDTRYIRSWTVGMDLRIIMKTIGKVVSHEGAE